MNGMNVVIRADASTHIGAGHVIRCLALAAALREQGAQVRFLCRALPGHVFDLIRAQGYVLIPLPDAPDWHAGRDAQACLAALENPVDWLVVDHYGLGAAWQQTLRTKAAHILVIDDLANRAHACDLLLDQNLDAAAHARHAALLPHACVTLLGPKFALLRPQFAAARQRLAPREGQVRRVLISYGGMDAVGESLKALTAFSSLADLAGLVGVDVIAGRANPHYQALSRLCATLPQCVLHEHVDDMATLMAQADLALGAGGGTAWERCCLGVPALVTALADNQAGPARALAEAGGQLYLGRAEALDAAAYARILAGVLALPDLLRQLSQQAQTLVDGLGAQRVVAAMRHVGLRLRAVTHADSASLLSWRNHPETRRYAFNRAAISLGEHANWLVASLDNPDRVMFIAEQGREARGVLRFDFDGDTATISIHVVPGLSGQGWGAAILRVGEHWLAANRADIRRLRADVLGENKASMQLFRSAGYTLSSAVFMKGVPAHA